MDAALQSLRAMIRTILAAAIITAVAAPASAETVQLHAGHLIDPGSGKVTDDRELIITDGKIVSVYYFNDSPDKERFIGATIWDPAR